MPSRSDNSIAELRSNWIELSDLDRANEINIIRHTNVSIRKIATGFQCSESLLRHLLNCLEASPQDQELARHNRISTNELVRRGKAAKEKRMAPPPDVVEAKREVSAREGADLICNWLAAGNFNCHHQEIIIERARDVIEECDRDLSLPAISKHSAIPPALIISRTKPTRPRGEGVALIDW